METQKVILPFFYALFHAGFSLEENSSPIVSPQKESALHSELAFISSENQLTALFHSGVHFIFKRMC